MKFLEKCLDWAYFPVELKEISFFWPAAAKKLQKSRAFACTFCYIFETAPKIQFTKSANEDVKVYFSQGELRFVRVQK